MKHTLKATLILIIFFFLAHLIGLFIVDFYLIQDLPYNIERPDIPEETSYLPIFLFILIGTIIALILIRFRAMKLWKLWFFISIVVTLSISFSTLFSQTWAIILAALLALVRIFRPGPIIHNTTELFIYGGLAAIFVPVLNIFSIFILLGIISIYDYIAVYKSKHMVKLAKFQTNSKIFTGLSLPYKRKESKTVSIAILGGGDIGFTLLFSGVILKTFGFYSAVITSAIISLSLLSLFILSKKNKFYPAMPILTLGCLIGYIFILFI